MSDESDALLATLRELRNTITGLSLEVEGLRLNNNSNSDFILDALRDVLAKLNKALDDANKL